MPVKGAIIGFGHIAANGHVPAYLANPDVSIEAVCDSHPERKTINERLLPGSRFYSSAQKLFEREEIDFVDVSTPPSVHATFILQALSSGRHVLCEKPLVLSSKDLQEISQTMKQSGKTVVTVHNWRYSPILQHVGRVLNDGEIGEITSIEYTVTRTQPSVAVGEEASKNWRLDPEIAGGGILVDHGWHAFYLVNEWAKAIPKMVECKLENRKFKDIRVEDTADVLFFYPGKKKARLFFTWAGNNRSNQIKIEGSHGRIIVLDDTIQVDGKNGLSKTTFAEGLSAGSHHPDWYGAVIDEFLQEIKDRDLKGRNFQEAACCFNLLNHCKKASSLASTVEVKGWEYD